MSGKQLGRLALDLSRLLGPTQRRGRISRSDPPGNAPAVRESMNDRESLFEFTSQHTSQPGCGKVDREKADPGAPDLEVGRDVPINPGVNEDAGAIEGAGVEGNLVGVRVVER